MGIGDDVITLARARAEYLNSGNLQCPVDRKGNPRTDRAVYQQSPYISPAGAIIEEYPMDKRPYEHETYYQAPRAEFHLTDEQETWAQEQARRPYIIINPDAKPNAHYSNNKHWHEPYWHELVQLLKQQYPQYRLVRANPGKFTTCYDLENISTPGVYDLIALIKYASWVITTEGAPHHIAAGTHTPCTVIYGHCTSPQTTGYPGQRALASDSGPCNSRQHCDQCRIEMQKITPQRVMETVEL
ncbi:ADP-heptose LPS heptosyltransferase II [Phage DSL-LC06]|nr:ADP-heptose LPS heptosyltransferase II [Phage DSL-LC06]